MGIDVSNRVIMYPFTPDSRPHLSDLAVFRDVFIMIPPGDFPGVSNGPRERYVVLKNIQAGPTSVLYEFEAGYSKGSTVVSFNVQRGPGIISTRSDDPATGSVLLVNGPDLPLDGYSTSLGSSPYAEVEPARVVWLTEYVKSLSFVNAYRNWNVSERGDGTPRTTILTLTGGEVRLRSGYNVYLSYNEDNETLYVKGAAGAGMGLPSVIPWDNPPPSTGTRVISINSLKGDVKILGKGSSVVKLINGSSVKVEV